MGLLSSDVHYGVLLNDIEATCMTEDTCGTCHKESCLIGYTKKCITDSLKNKVTYVENGVQNIPHDMRAFETAPALDAIAHILRQCKSCEENHFEDCLVNVIRSCYEIIAFGDGQQYKGSIFMYLNEVETQFPEHAAVILKEFQAYKR